MSIIWQILKEIIFKQGELKDKANYYSHQINYSKVIEFNNIDHRIILIIESQKLSQIDLIKSNTILK